MENSTITGGNLLRLMGFMGICVGVAWALQVLGFAGGTSTFGRIVWIVAAASIAGAGTGLIAASASLQGVPAKARTAEAGSGRGLKPLRHDAAQLSC